METVSVMEKDLPSTSKDFYHFHGVQLIGINFPTNPKLLTNLHEKLKNQTFDSGNYFEMLENEDLEKFQLQAKVDMKAKEQVFLIDHAITFKYSELRTIITQNEKVMERLMYMLKYADKKPQHPKYPKTEKQASTVKVLEFDNAEIEDPLKVEVPLNVVGVSFYGNNITDIEKVKEFCNKHKDLKVLWLNENPISEHFDKLKETIEKEFPQIELLNSAFTSNATEWGIKFAHCYPKSHRLSKLNLQEMKYLDLSKRNIFNLKDYKIFENLNKLRVLNLKDHTIESFEEINKFIQLLKTIPNLKHILCDSKVEDIIWEFHEQKKLVDICKSLQTVNGYYFAYGKPHKNEEKLKFISKNIWKMANSYRLASSEQLDETSTWYMMDEVGNAVEHSENPNSIMSPFLFAPNNKLDENVISYSILWLTHDVKAGDIISRDYLCGIDESRGRISRLNVWFDLPKHPFYEKARAHNKLLAIKTVEGQEYIKKFPDLNEKEKAEQKTKNYNLPKSHPLKVITDNGLLIENLKSPNFAFTNDPKEADIIWLVANLTDNFEKFNGQFINQFPYEACIVMKHNLARTTYDGLGNVPWLQKTFNLDYELDSFVGEFKLREKNHQSNWWIIKPPNMARSMDMVVTDNLDAIIRVLETGPKLAQKYIHRPLTLRGKKIDLRFVIVLRSLEPLEVFIYKVFWIRTSNNTFSLDPRSLDTYETHFTVMNYGRKLEQIHFDEFIKDFNEENKEKNVKWDDVYQNIKIMVKELFLAVKRTHPQMHWPNARSVYGLDVMIDQHFQPKILEMTYSPDCGRACKYHPTFFEDLFNCLFRNEDEKTNVDKLF